MAAGKWMFINFKERSHFYRETLTLRKQTSEARTDLIKSCGDECKAVEETIEARDTADFE